MLYFFHVFYCSLYLVKICQELLNLFNCNIRYLLSKVHTLQFKSLCLIHVIGLYFLPLQGIFHVYLNFYRKKCVSRHFSPAATQSMHSLKRNIFNLALATFPSSSLKWFFIFHLSYQAEMPFQAQGTDLHNFFQMPVLITLTISNLYCLLQRVFSLSEADIKQCT